MEGDIRKTPKRKTMLKRPNTALRNKTQRIGFELVMRTHKHGDLQHLRIRSEYSTARRVLMQDR